jgi:predicted PurR-regulated permease PerM
MTNLPDIPVIDLSSNGDEAQVARSEGSKSATGFASHCIEFIGNFFVAILVRLAFFLSGRRLSAGIYKICTLLSTRFVENIDRAKQATPRKALSGAVFRATPHAHW